ncbi:MAG: sugar phosphate isomerase/epimerase [Bacteroidetes bacterium]|nr:sugar phosphate isomerase/epimerase [Bacteroidota bacterium]MDA1120254.1 sugar phosphate isomerase/epimerase [Bacteroidota bacterium]
MKRRKFVKQGSALAAGGLLYSCGGSSTTQSTESTEGEETVEEVKKLDDIGIQLYTLRNELQADGADRAAILKKVADVGYKHVEMYMLGGKHHLGYTREEFKSILDDLGMRVTSAHVGIGGPDNPMTLTNGFEQVIDDAVFLGQKYIVCPHPGRIESIDAWKAKIDIFNGCGEQCKAAGVQFGYHNHALEFEEVDGQIPFDIIMQNSDPSIIQFELDMYWSIMAGAGSVELFNKYPNRFPLWHVKDMSKEKENETTFLGGGSIDYESVFANGGNAGRDLFYVEQEHYPIDAYQSIQKCYDYLSAINA